MAAAVLMMPSVAPPAVFYLALIVVLLLAVQAQVLLQQLFQLVYFLRLYSPVVYPIFLQLIV